MANNIDGAISLFERTFYERAQRTDSVLINSGVCEFKAVGGAEVNEQSMGQINFQKTTGTNPDAIYQDWEIGNRKFSTDRFHVSLLIDNKIDDIEQLMSPDGELMRQAKAGFSRKIDEYGVRALLGPVNIAKAGLDSSNIISAAADGVVSIDATSGMSYAKLLSSQSNFLARDIMAEEASQSVFLGSQDEWEDLMNDDKFINSDYYANRMLLNQGKVSEVFGRTFHFLGGSMTGYTHPNPILEETIGGERKCISACKKSLAMQLTGMKTKYIDDVQGKADSRMIKITFYIGAMRREGKKVQLIRTACTA